MEIPVRFAYLFLNFGFGILWVIFFVFLTQTRKIQLQISLLAAPLGPMIECLYFRDYWFPMGALGELNIGPFRLLAEDFAFAFFFTGTTGILAHLTGKKVKDFRLSMPIKLIGIGLVSMAIATPLFLMGLNSIFATSVSFLLIAGLVSMTKKKSWKYSLRCGIASALMMIVIYFITFNLVSNSEELFKTIWFLYGHPVLGVRVLGIPITEIVWGFSWGVMMGSVRDYTFG